MSKTKSVTIEFQVEPADRGVGVMSESFSACVKVEDGFGRIIDGSHWCVMDKYEDDLGACEFAWYFRDSGNACKPPSGSGHVTAALHGFAQGHYADQDYDETTEPETVFVSKLHNFP